MTKKHTILLAAATAAVLSACSTQSDSTAVADGLPAWLEPDSATAIHQRLLRDFPVTFDEGAAEIIAKYPQYNIDDIRDMVQKHYIETMVIDGQERMFRKALRNVALLNPDLNEGWKHRGWDASPQRMSYADSVIRYTAGTLPDGGAHRVALRFKIDVPYDSCLAGDTLRVWMPYPIESARQSDIKLLGTSHQDYVISTPQQSAHRTIYMSAPVADGDTTHFEYSVEFTTAGQYFSPYSILADLKPYDKQSAEYKKYTSFDGPHYARLDSLAKVIVGDETNPYKQSERVYDYIIQHYPWAGAREYSTIPCIPQYVVDERHGDCGQVALLYISLMRTLGVPARWESGWMLHPGEKNLHDWAEVYFEGVGWVPVDVSFGRYTSSDSADIQKFYSTGIDSYRFAANTGVGEAFFPAKRYMRSETVDSQMGEVECSKGNLFYPGWDQNLEIITIKPVKR